MEVLRQAPDRVSRIALFGTRASMEARNRSVADQGSLATAPHADPQLSAIVSGPAQAMAERVGPLVFARQQQALLERPDIAEAIATIRVPALVAVGERDRICTPDDASALAALIPGARFHILKSCGHLSPMERPGEVTMLLREWLTA
jgi:pimeloyl-ACP methyl ester carboxylesterase